MCFNGGGGERTEVYHKKTSQGPGSSSGFKRLAENIPLHNVGQGHFHPISVPLTEIMQNKNMRTVSVTEEN
jgi:hypothetical protein